MGLQILKRVTPQAYIGIQNSIPKDLRKQAVKVVSGYSKPTAKRFAETFAYRFAEFFKSIFGQSDLQKLRREMRKEMADSNRKFKHFRKSDQKAFVKWTLKGLISGNSLELHHVPPSKINAKMDKYLVKKDKLDERAEKHAEKDAEKRAKIEAKKGQQATRLRGEHSRHVHFRSRDSYI